ncbi:MAG TPA: metal-dependent hydrolase [Planctomycetota bacterium]|nr:metal-dependent hydrolase [Planctomycetota bacterium]
MPFTPFHMGPGIFLKAVLQGSFSLMVFGWAQIVMDIQPLIVLLTGKGHLHGFTHTYLGATLIGAFSAVTGKYVSQLALSMLLGAGSKGTPIAWWVALLSGFVGSYSHVVLDSLMHADVEPYFPFSAANDLLGLVSVEALHKFCVYSGLAGAALYVLVSYGLSRRRR